MRPEQSRDEGEGGAAARAAGEGAGPGGGGAGAGSGRPGGARTGVSRCVPVRGGRELERGERPRAALGGFCGAGRGRAGGLWRPRGVRAASRALSLSLPPLGLVSLAAEARAVRKYGVWPLLERLKELGLFSLEETEG